MCVRRTRAQARKLVEIAARPLVPKQGEGLLGGRVYHHKLMFGFKAKSKAETSGDAGFEPAYMKLLGGELKERDERSEAPLRGMVAGPSVVGCA